MYKLIIDKIKDKKIAILGYGREGKSTYKFIRKYLPEKEITIIDKEELDIDDMYTVTVSGEDYLSNLEIFDLIIKTPGISLKDIDITNIKDKITSQLELILEVNRKNIIGITGTKGKSTTSSLTYEVIKKQNNNVFLLGNIGIPIFDNIEEYNEETILVIEMSSHQLEYIKVSPHIAVILNLYQDHLDHSGTLEHYHNNKMNIFKYQNEEDYSLFTLDNEYLSSKLNEYNYKGKKYNITFTTSEDNNTTNIKENKVYLNNELLYIDEERKLIGEHNLKNIMFVVTIAKILNLDLSIASKTISEFKGLKYRIEHIGKYNNIDYYNDTIATIPDATISAVNAIKNVDTLIFGGLDRGIDYSEFIEFLRNSNINNLICMPTTGTNIGKQLEDTNKNIIFVNTLEEAYIESKKYTKENYSCLLSPAAASYEFFKNFEEKGAKFESIVKSNNE